MQNDIYECPFLSHEALWAARVRDRSSINKAELSWVKRDMLENLAACNGVCRTKPSMITVDHCITSYHFLWSWNSNWDSSIMHLWSPIQKISMADQATLVSPLHSPPWLLADTFFNAHTCKFMPLTTNTNGFKCRGRSFGGLFFNIAYAIKSSVQHFFCIIIKNHHKCLHNDFFPLGQSNKMSSFVSGQSDILDYMGWEIFLYSALFLSNWII